MDTKINIEIPEIVLKEITGEATSEEIIQVEKWISDSSKNRSEYLRFKRIHESAKNANVEFDAKNAWNKVHTRLQTKQEARIISLSKSSVYSTVLRYAAIALLLIGLGSSVLYFMNSKIKQSDLLVFNSGDSQKEIQLEDGSRIFLNKNSRLEYPKKFSGKNREVNLSGEAFFEIERNPQKPFIVHLEKSSVKVLGTKFNISAYTKMDNITVSVASGLVKFSYTNGKEVFLEKNTYATLSKERGYLTKTMNLDANYLSWKTKLIVFENKSLEEVICSLENTYSTGIVLKNNDLKKLHLTATFNNQNIENVMNILSETLNLKITKQENNYEIDKK